MMGTEKEIIKQKSTFGEADKLKIDIKDFYRKEMIKKSKIIPKETFYNRFLKVNDYIMISKPYDKELEKNEYRISYYDLIKSIDTEEVFGVTTDNYQKKMKKRTYTNNLSFENFTIGDIVVATSPGFHVQGAIRHAALFDSRRYHGNEDDKCLLTAEPDRGVIYESIKFYHENFGEAWGLYVPDTTLDQRIAIVNELTKHLGEPYRWNAHKKRQQEWYCSMVPWKGYYMIAGIDLDYNGGHWVLPIDILMSKHTAIFEYSRG